MSDGLDAYVASFAIGLLTLAFCWKFVPETKGKRLEDIEAYFQNRVARRGTSA